MSTKIKRLNRRRGSVEHEGFFETHGKMLFLSFWTSLVFVFVLIDYQADGVIEAKGAKVSGFIALCLVLMFSLFALISVISTVRDILKSQKRKE